MTNHRKHIAIFRILVILSTVVGADVLAEDKQPVNVPHWDSFEAAGKRYGIDPVLLASVAKVESDYDQSAKNTNRDGSIDVGIMQINNKYWAQPLDKIGISWEMVETSADTNINVGAWILAQAFQEAGVGWLAIGAYNAGFSDKKRRYRRHYAVKVYEALRSLERERDNL